MSRRRRNKNRACARERLSMQNDDAWRECTYNALCVAILSAHRQVQAECIRVDDINVTGFRAAQGVDAPIEWFVGANLDGNSGVFAVHGHCCSSDCVRKNYYLNSNRCGGTRDTYRHNKCRSYRNWHRIVSYCSALDLRWHRIRLAMCDRATGWRQSMESLQKERVK